MGQGLARAELLGPGVLAAAAAAGGEAAAGSSGTCIPPSHLTECSVPALGGHPAGQDEAAKPLGANRRPRR